LHAVSDNQHVLTGLALAGVQGQPASTPSELSRALECMAKDIGIVIITSSLANKCTEVLDKYRQKNPHKLVSIIPETKSATPPPT